MPVPMQPPPYYTPFLDETGTISEVWRRFFLAAQTAITFLLQTQQRVGSMQGLMPIEDPADDRFAFVIPGPPGPPGAAAPSAAFGAGFMLGAMDVPDDAIVVPGPPGPPGLDAPSVPFGAGFMLGSMDVPDDPTPIQPPGFSGIAPVGGGGTGLGTYAIGDVLYASAVTTLSRLADVAAGSVLASGGVGVAPGWSGYTIQFGTGGSTTNILFLNLQGDSGVNADVGVEMSRGGVFKSSFAVVGGNARYTPGSLTNDLVFTMSNQNILFNVDNGISDLLKLSPNTLTAGNGGSTNADFILNLVGETGASSNGLYINWKRGATLHAVTAIAGGVGAWSPGTVVGDMIFRSASRSFFWTTDSGTSDSMSLDTSHHLRLKGLVKSYGNITTAGNGLPAIYGAGRSTAQTGAVSSVAAYTVSAADGSFIVSMNILITAFTAGTISGVVTYTDEGGTARSLTLNFSSVTGVLGTTAGAAGAFEGVPMHIRVNASTAITCTTTVSVFTGTYNVEGVITQIA